MTVALHAGLSRHRNPVVESPAVTVVTTAGPVINASRVPGTASSGPFDTFALTAANGFIIFNGVPDTVTSANVIGLHYIGHRTYQQNQALLWWVWSGPGWVATSDPRVPAPAGVPAQAAAQSFTTLVVNADMSSASQVSADTSGGTIAPLYGWGQFGAAGTPNGGLAPSGWNFANGELVITGSGAFGQGISTACSKTPATSTHGAIASNTGQGLAFRYGYFEGVLGWDMTIAGNRTFWLNYLVNSILEIDVMESADSVPAKPASAIHKWGGSDGLDNGPDVAFGGPLSALVINTTPGSISYNKFGLLWAPDFLQTFINDQPGPKVDLNATLNWWAFGQSGPPYNGSGSINAYAGATAGFLYLQMGIWPGTGPLHVKSIKVYQ